MSTVRAQNMKQQYILSTIRKIARKQLNCPQEWKIRLQGQPIGKLSLKEDLSNEDKRLSFSTKLQESLGRTVEIGTAHIYVGDKLF